MNQCFVFFSADRSPFNQRRTTTTGVGQGIAQQSHHRCCVPSSNGAITDRWTWSGPRCLLCLGRGGSGVEVFLNFCLQSPNTVCHVFACSGASQSVFRETVFFLSDWMAGDFEIDSLFSNPIVVFQMLSEAARARWISKLRIKVSKWVCTVIYRVYSWSLNWWVG